ncbi:MAG: chromosome segregation protein SMC [bacterium]|nr:chromosome segregation protein SMC [bacterium]
MRLKRLEQFGFKSFADRTVMDFGSDTLTGIVGPNGCGKSNVVDSVRWVLGETRPTSMRGAGMTDVIFKGSSSRPGMSVAEVTIVLDNDDESIEERGPEVSVTRRLFKTGESEYLIDGDRVRLKDVKDMLFNTGLGSRGYSVLEQGKIDAVLSANPKERRSIFEEAAGISRYRQRRHEAELRLKRVSQDTDRLEDLMGELRTRVRSLKIQAGKAERYVAAREEWTRERRRFLQHRLDTVDTDLSELVPALTEIEQRLTDLRGERSELDGEVSDREKERSTVVAQLDRVSSEAGQLSGEVRAMDERKNQLALRVHSWESSSNEERERSGALADLAAERSADAERMRGELAELASALDAAVTRARELTRDAKALGDDYRDVRKQVEDQNAAVLSCLHDRTAAQNRVHHLEEGQAPAAARLERCSERLAGLDAQVAEVQGERSGAEQALEVARTDLAGTEERRVERAQALENVTAQEERTKERHTELSLERAKVRATIESLLDRDRELEDLEGGARRVLEAVSAGEGPCPADALLGFVADHLRIDTRLARALDAALGERAFALVAKDADAARAIVDWCAQSKSGQVGVVVPAAFAQTGERSLAGELTPIGAGGTGGVEGGLSSLISCDESMRPLARALLANVVVVDTLERACELVGAHPEMCFVTPEGERVDAAGIVGGFREVTQGAVGRRASAAELESTAVSLGRQLGSLESELAQREREAVDLRGELQQLDATREEQRTRAADAESSFQTASARLDDLLASRQLLEHERQQAEDEVANLAADLAGARTELEQASAAFEAENGRLAEMEAGRRGLEEKRETLTREVSLAEVERARLSSERGALDQRIVDLERQIAETQSEAARCGQRAASFEQNAVQGTEEGERIAEESVGVLEERGKLDERLEELRSFERTGAERIGAVRTAAEAVQNRLDDVGEELSDQKLAIQRLELAREELVTRALEELELDEMALTSDFEVDPELAEDGALDALDRRVAGLRDQLEKLGPVNMEAMVELEEVGGRLEFLETQSTDLADSRKTLAETIDKIDTESRRLFLEAFEEVRGNFQIIFRQLFGGGRADIRFAESEDGAELDVLEAGIEIVARPPGRELLSIGLLSGGQRTMTALALLFAVFDARPSPFCVLDEVDAALDDANIDRFLGMLDGFRKTTQFIVVTHNKGTMEACQSLYGVTMEVKGVSRFVSVELDEAVAMSPEVEAAKANGKSEAVAQNGQNGTARDAESGEPVVEIVPARGVEEEGTEVPEVPEAQSSETN